MSATGHAADLHVQRPIVVAFLLEGGQLLFARRRQAEDARVRHAVGLGAERHQGLVIEPLGRRLVLGGGDEDDEVALRAAPMWLPSAG